MKEETYIFDDDFFKRYRKDDKLTAILTGEDGIKRKPACWSSYFWIMVKTFQKRRDTPAKKLLWNRYFCAHLSEIEKKELGIDGLEPLGTQEEKSLLEYVAQQLKKLGIVPQYPKPWYLPHPQNDINFESIYWNDEFSLNFQRFIFPRNVSVWLTRFPQKVNFNEAQFLGSLRVSHTVFVGNINFRNASFTDRAAFDRVVFEKDAFFDHTKFLGYLSCRETTFKERVRFNRVCFKKDINFKGTSFYKEVNFQGSNAQSMLFHNAQFQKGSTARFDDIACAGEFNFSNVDCHPRLFLTRANLQEVSLNFEGSYFRDGMNLDRIQYPKHAGDTEIHRLSWRELRNIAASKGDAKQELDFLAYELQARQKNKKDENLSVRFIIAAYGWFSDYGRSIASPIKSLILVNFMFFIIYGFIFLCHALSAYQYENRSKITFPDTSALALSFYESSVFLPIPDAERYQYLKKQLFTLDCALIKEELQKEYCRPESDNPKEQSYLMENAYYCYSVVASVQKLLSLLLILLLGNSIRNHLRMR